MKIAKKQNSRKVITIYIILVIILTALATFLYFKTNFFGNNPKNNTPNTELIDQNPPITEQPQNSTDTKTNNTDTPTSPTVIKGSDKKQVDLVIINFSSTALNVQINTVTSTGSCTLTLTSTSHETITQTSGIQPLASVSACDTFNYTKLPSGNWTIDVTYSSDTLTGSVSDTRTIQ